MSEPMRWAITRNAPSARIRHLATRLRTSMVTLTKTELLEVADELEQTGN